MGATQGCAFLKSQLKLAAHMQGPSVSGPHLALHWTVPDVTDSMNSSQSLGGATTAAPTHGAAAAGDLVVATRTLHLSCCVRVTGT